MINNVFLPKLLSVDYSTDVVWSGAYLFVKTSWTNDGTAADFRGKICLDFEFYNLRQMRGSDDDLSIKFTPYPNCTDWSTERICTVGTKHRFPFMWGGARRVFLTLLDDNSLPVPFIGRDGKTVMREYVGMVEMAWDNSPSCHPLHVEISKKEVPSGKKPADLIPVGNALLCRDKPCVVSFRDEPLDSFAPSLVIRNVQNSRICHHPVYSTKLLEHTDTEALYHLASEDISCDIRFRVTENELTLTLENPTDTTDTELISVYYPHLISLGGKDNYLVDFFTTGRLVSAQDNWPIGLSFPFDVDNFAGMYNENLCAVLSATSLDTVLSHGIEEISGEKYAVIGADLRVKVPNELNGQPSLTVRADVSVKLQFEEKGDWQTIAKILRRDLPAYIDPQYQNCLVQKWMLDPGKKALDDVIENIRIISALTDNYPQIVYVVGWQKGGHDFMYPNPTEINAGIPSIEYLNDKIRECKEKYNTCLSFHDNFDDGYLEYDFDHNLLARDQMGGYYRGWIWGIGQSYILSPKRYVSSGIMAERVKRQVETFDLAGSYHIDVITSEVRRYDYSPDMMAAADENFRYKLAILDEFQKYGLDVTSEVLAVPTLGKMSFTWHIRTGRDRVFQNERMIPLTPLLYHGKAVYNNPSSCSEKALLEAMMFGAMSVTQDLSGYKDEHGFAYYMLTIPINKFAMMEIEHFEFENDNNTVRAIYGSDSYVEVDFANMTYTMLLDGKIIGKDWVTIVQTSPETILAYARDKGEHSFEVPKGWERVSVSKLTQNGPEIIPEIQVIGGMLSLQLPEKTPIKISKI